MKINTLRILAVLLFLINSRENSAFSRPKTPSRELTGEIEILISDDFSKGSSVKEYWLIQANSDGRTKLEFKKKQDQLEAGDRIKVIGQGTNKVFMVDDYQRE